MKAKIIGLILGLSFSIASFSQVAVPQMLEKALGSVVTVAVYETENTMKPLGFRGDNAEMAYAKALDLTGSKGSGSGFFIQRNGKTYVVTNAHVIQNASDADGSIFVYSINYTKYLAKLVGGDSFYDIAVLELDKKPGAEVSHVDFRKSDILIGEQVFAIGNPLGEYPYSVTSGIISAKNRVRGGLTGKFGFLQSTATVIWGNSGGPLIDSKGEAVGINSQIAFAQNGGQSIWQPQINFALEANIANKLVNDIINNNGLIKRAYLGIEVSKKVADLTKISRFSGITVDELPVVSAVIAGGPAETALGKYIGYSIIAVNGEKVRNIEEVLGVFEKTSPNSVVKLDLKFNNKIEVASFKCATTTAETTADIAKYAIQLWGSKSLMDNNGISLNFYDKNKYSNFQKQATEAINIIGTQNKLSSDVLFNSDWLVVASGVLSQNGNQVWRVKDNADLGSAFRLSAITGVVDLVLFKKGSDPSNGNNFIQKRFMLSGQNNLYKQTLWY